jgi:hypothetical protein
MRLPSISAFCLALATSACASQNIPNTDVEDSIENREVVSFCERYREAVEERNVGVILNLASQRYFDDNGTPTGEDDLDYRKLADKLAVWRESVLDVRYEIRYRRIAFVRDRILVDFTYTGSFRVGTGEGNDRWSRRLADNRLVLTREGEDFRIISGL